MIHRARKAASLPLRSKVFLSISYALFGGALVLLLIFGLADYIGYTLPQKLAYVFFAGVLFFLSYLFYRMVREVDILDYFAIMFIPSGMRVDRWGRAADLNSNFLLLAITLVGISPILYTIRGGGAAASITMFVGGLLGVLAAVGYILLLRRS